jgi:oxygen-dependent protoporphyrinogen oxidase
MRAVLAELPGVVLAGAAVDGVGIPACIASARAAADEVLHTLRADATIGT